MRAPTGQDSRRLGGLASLVVAVGLMACGPERQRSSGGDPHGTPSSGGSAGTPAGGGSGDDGGEESAPSAPASPGCAAWASAYCTWLASCYETVVGGTEEACEARFE